MISGSPRRLDPNCLERVACHAATPLRRRRGSNVRAAVGDFVFFCMFNDVPKTVKK